MNKSLVRLISLSAACLLLSSCGGNGGSSASQSSYPHAFSPYTVGNTTNAEAHDYSKIVVNGPTNALSSDFAFGVDCSEVYQLESLGARYYWEDGKEEDIFKILAAEGANYVRFRNWVDPWSKDGESYGGGMNDTYTDVYLAKRAQAAGLKILIDFHYSDSWADPSKQWMPKAWVDVGKAEIPAKVKEYTVSALNEFKNNGVTVDAVQVGNETNNKIAGIASSYTSLTAEIITSGTEGAKEVFPNCKSIIHLTNIKSTSGITSYLTNLVTKEAKYDIVGFSYYPYWHGSKANLLKVLSDATALTKKPVMIVETSWGFTDDANDYCVNQFSTESFGQTGGYVTSAQGQAAEMSDLVDILSQVPGQMGQGLFYWGASWIPAQGMNWVSKAGAYYNDHGTDGTGDYADSYILPSWSNQALFSYTGKVLPSASTYKHIKALDKQAAEVVSGLLNDSLSCTINLADEESSLPTSAQGMTNTGAYRDLAITWDADEVAAMKAAGDGTYTIHGTTDNGGFAVTCAVIAESNFVQDYSFEKQAEGQEVAVGGAWANTCDPEGVSRIEAKSEGNRTGSKYFHWYSTVAFSFELTQTITGVRKGVYSLRTYIMSIAASGYTKINMWVSVAGGEKIIHDSLPQCTGWESSIQTGMKESLLSDIEIATDYSEVQIGLTCEGKAGSWGHNDDWSLVKTADIA